MAQDKVDLVSSYQKLNQARVEYKMKDIENIAMVGGDVPENMKAEIDSLYGDGWTDKYLEASIQAAQAADETAQIKTMQDIAELLKSYPAGKLLPIGDSIYETIGSSSDTQIFREDDGRNYSYITMDKRTGETINIATGGKVAPKSSGGGGSSGGKESYFTRPVDGKVKYFFGNPNSWESAQELTSQEYLKAKSSAQGVLDPQENQYANYNDKLQYVESYKEMGLGEKDAIAQYIKDFGIWDDDADIAFGTTYSGIGGLVEDWLNDDY
jgi:hypothetical protein